MDEHILTTLKILIIGESGVGKSRLVQVQFHFICVWALEVIFGRTFSYLNML